MRRGGESGRCCRVQMVAPGCSRLERVVVLSEMNRSTQRSLSIAIAIIAVIIHGIYSSPVFGCSICQSGDPLAPVGTAKLDSGQVQIALHYEYLTAQARSDDNPYFIETLTQMTLRPVVAFSPWGRLSVVIQAPIVYKDFGEWFVPAPGTPIDSTADFNPTRTQPTGLGDVDLGIRLFALDRKDFDRFSWHRLGVSIGSSLPTGSNDAQANGERIDEHAQLGTGAFGPYGGILYAFSQDPWNFFGSVSGKFPLTNGHGYKYGAALLWSIAGEYRIIERLSLGVGLDGRYAARDVRNGEYQENTGGFVLAAVPIVKFNLYDELWLTARAQLPIATHLFGEQSVGPTFITGVQYTF